jgi:hypothetical protein
VTTLAVSIEHQRDVVVIDGQVNQDYNFLIYTFGSAAEARAYFDEPVLFRCCGHFFQSPCLLK